jgi:hypothetical protein
MCSFVLVTGMGLVFLYRVGLSVGGIKDFLKRIKA